MFKNKDPIEILEMIGRLSNLKVIQINKKVSPQGSVEDIVYSIIIM